MTPVLSGGLVYEYSQEPSDYGLVQINDDGSAKLRSDYDALQSQYNTLNITALQGIKAQKTSVVPPTCSSSLITNSGFDNNFTIPAVPPGVQDLIDSGIKNAPVGKLVDVKSTKVTQTVQASNGDTMQGLEITLLANDQSNNPSGANQRASTTTTSSAPAASTSKKSGAENLCASLSVLLGVALFVAGWSSSF
jgi:hypothetical protein